MSAPDPEPLPYRVETANLTPQSLNKRVHPLDSDARRITTSLGDACGLSKLGVHYCRVAPHSAGTVLHWHSNEDEWFYIIDAGPSGATLIIHSEGDAAPREEKVVTGDFLGFPAGTPNAHALRAGDQELVYLCGGTRADVDLVSYPLLDKSLVVDRTKGGRDWFIDNVKKEPR
jgi:uncharacterized cupin superfamily protein